jgi:hypothetical protein
MKISLDKVSIAPGCKRFASGTAARSPVCSAFSLQSSVPSSLIGISPEVGIDFSAVDGLFGYTHSVLPLVQGAQGIRRSHFLFRFLHGVQALRLLVEAIVYMESNHSPSDAAHGPLSSQLLWTRGPTAAADRGPLLEIQTLSAGAGASRAGRSTVALSLLSLASLTSGAGMSVKSDDARKDGHTQIVHCQHLPAPLPENLKQTVAERPRCSRALCSRLLKE